MLRAGDSERIPPGVSARRRVLAAWINESCCAAWIFGLIVGLTASAGAFAFRRLLSACTHLLTGWHGPTPNWWVLLLAPVAAGAVYGPLSHRFEGAPARTTSLTDPPPFATPPPGTPAFAAAAILCIGGGGSVGTTGPIIRLGTAGAGSIARWISLAQRRTRLLVACGAAAALTTALDAPLAGPVFALEIAAAECSAATVGAVVAASASATLADHYVFAVGPPFLVPPLMIRHLLDLPLSLALSLLVGIVCVGFSWILRITGHLCDRVWKGPRWARPAVGGLPLGALLATMPPLYGVGWTTLTDVLHRHYALGMLSLLLAGKMLATALTFGIGGRGGMFAPTLLVGALTGVLFGTVAHTVLPAVTADPGTYGLIGMTAALATMLGIPATAIVLTTDATGAYAAVPLLAAASFAARGVARRMLASK
ncbi:chloride channel protein [Nocardia huaxiensis]|uniref:chloride channel protein n=1 Tax=Nocardia huaxiensis TaxID=2755382 RepID=UPI001E2B2758|nr:chloride channel protein [Nocardia huaxiensis]UFS97072.1 chloride channel protein [Nocardia huaxiensis]